VRIVFIFIVTINMLFSMNLCKNRYKFSYVYMNLDLYFEVTKDMLERSYKYTISSCKIKELFDKVHNKRVFYKKTKPKDCIFCLMRILIINDKNQKIIIRKDKKVIDVDKKMVYSIDKRLIDDIIEDLGKKVGVKNLEYVEKIDLKNAIPLSP